MSASLNSLSVLRHFILRTEMCRFQETNWSVVSLHWSTPLHLAQYLLGKVVSTHAKNFFSSAPSWKKVKAEKYIVGRGKERGRRAKKFVLVLPSQQFQALHESHLEASAASHITSFLFCISEPLSPSHRCAREWGGEDPWCQRRWCLESVFWWDSPRDRGWICNALRHWINIPGHDVRRVSCGL